jgi:carbamoylphosphate synthase large subunit
MIDHGFGNYIPKVYDKITYPCIIKKPKSSSGKGSYIIQSKKDIPKHQNLSKYIIQEYIRDQNEYATHIIFKDRKVLIHQTNLYYYFKSVHINDEHTERSIKVVNIDDSILEIFKGILSLCNYTGYASIDYKIVNNLPKIFEINPRIGSSLTKNKKYFDKFLKVYTSHILPRGTAW